jgi:CelD/BcsL family acetyltransferase involved in cellulose biosynthesis
VKLEPLGNLHDARPVWELLERASANPFATWMFAELWWRHLGGRRPLWLLGVRAGDQVVALLPVYDRERELRLLGHGDADLLGPIGVAEQHPLALRCLSAFVTAIGKPLIADELPAGSSVPLGGTVVRRTPSPVLDLPVEGFDALLATRSRNLRSGVRTRERRLARAYEVKIRTAEEHTLSRDLETLFALHHARWKGSTSVFSGPRVPFHRELAQRALARGWLRLRLLELDGRPVAVNYALRVGDAEWYYQTGRDPAFGRASVGAVLHAACIRCACEEGAREYRMLRGDQRYKRSWCNRDAPLETVLVEAAP